MSGARRAPAEEFPDELSGDGLSGDGLSDDGCSGDRVLDDGTPHQPPGSLHHQLLSGAIAAGRRFAPGTAADGQTEADRWLRREAPRWLAALRAAAKVGDHRRVMEVAEAVHWFSDRWTGAGPWEEVFALGRDAARAVGDTRSEAVFLNYSSSHYVFGLGRYPNARDCAVAALACARRAGDREQAAWALLHSAVAMSPTDGDLAVLTADRAAAEFDLLRHPEGSLRALATAVRTLSSAGRYEEARTYLRRLDALLENPVDDRLRALAAPALAWACLLDGEGLVAEGRREDAERVYRRGLAGLQPQAAPRAEVMLCLGLAGVLPRHPESLPEETVLLRRALDVAVAAEDASGVTWVLRALDDRPGKSVPEGGSGTVR